MVIDSGLAGWPRRVLMAAVRAYRFALSPWLATHCRFEPSCSSYALEALQRHGACLGTGLAVCRICRCNPFSAGGFDPVPVEAPRLFRYLTPAGADRAEPTPPSSTDPASP